MNVAILSCKSLLNRKVSAFLSTISIALSISLYVLVSMIKDGTRRSFEQGISYVDLVVGARSNEMQLLLQSLFFVGAPQGLISSEAFEEISHLPQIKWALPIVTGDSFRGYPVVGTLPELFALNNAATQELQIRLAEGKLFHESMHAVIGSDFARAEGIELGRNLILAHGLEKVAFHEHDEHPFVVVGILQSTGTPLDRAILVHIDDLAKMHTETEHGYRDEHEHGHEHHGDHHHHDDHEHHGHGAYNAIWIGLNKKSDVLHVQRKLQEFESEPLTAIIPGLSFAHFWQNLAMFDRGFLAIIVVVVLSSLLGMIASIWTTLQERKREVSILRALGARPWQIALTLLIESTILGFAGIGLGLGIAFASAYAILPLLANYFGFHIQLMGLEPEQILTLFAFGAGTVFAGVFPAIKIYQQSLAEGLSVQS